MIILKIIIKKKFKLFVAKKEATEKTSLDKKSLKIEKKKFVLKDGKKKMMRKKKSRIAKAN